jgi:hypothetical protein
VGATAHSQGILPGVQVHVWPPRIRRLGAACHCERNRSSCDTVRSLDDQKERPWNYLTRSRTCTRWLS